MTDAEYSISHGQPGFQLAGSGGIVNIYRNSASSDKPASDKRPDDFYPTCGREPIANPDQIYCTGQGGTGTLRSPSHDPNTCAEIEKAERGIIEYVAAHEGAVYSSSRGGISDMNRSCSHNSATSTTSTAKFSMGQGGASNIASSDGHTAEFIDEEECRKRAPATEGLHSTGRGGVASITSKPEPAIEPHYNDAPQRDCDRSSSPSSPPCFMNEFEGLN